MHKWKRKAAVVLSAAVAAGALVAPGPASAHVITECYQRISSNGYAINCLSVALDSDTISAHIRCSNGYHYSSGNWVTPFWGGWTGWVGVTCPSGYSRTSHWMENYS
jgi:hypothetical protein